MNKVFHFTPAAAATAATPSPQAAAPTATATPNATATAGAAPQAAAASQVDVHATLTQLAQKKGEKLNWQTSIVDLMKVLDLDSSLSARKQLAQELHFTGNMEDSASMNTWLQKEVLKRFAQNGGKLPQELLH